MFVYFRLNKIPAGQANNIFIVGSSPSLGSWDTDKAVLLRPYSTSVNEDGGGGGITNSPRATGRRSPRAGVGELRRLLENTDDRHSGHCYAINYNVLRIISGMGGLAYTN